MRPAWETGLRGRIYAFGRRWTPLSLRRALRRRGPTERLFGIHKPPVEIDWTAPEPGPPLPGRPDILVLPVVGWSYRRQRPQQLAEALARRGLRVFYGSLDGMGEPREPSGAGGGVTLLPIAGARREDLPERRLRGRVLAKALAGLGASRRRFELADVVLLAQSPYWAPLAAALRERLGWRVVYDCLDAHEAFPANRPGVLAEAERSMASSADLVVATSEGLRLRMEKWNASSRLLPNACDFDLFAAVPPPRAAGPLTVGYAGTVDEWFDVPLFDRLTELAPNWRFEIVGGLEGRTRPPATRSNVRLHGERPHGEMPAFRALLDVEIIPFRLSPLTHATDPVKLYEAAASGRMVVATPMEALRPLARRGVVRLAATAEAFVREISAAAAERAAAAPRQRAFARENTWDARAATLESWIRNLPRPSAAVSD